MSKNLEFDRFVLENRKRLFLLLEDFAADLIHSIYSAGKGISSEDFESAEGMIDEFIKQDLQNKKIKEIIDRIGPAVRSYFNIDLIGNAKLRLKIDELGFQKDEWYGKVDTNNIMRESIQENEKIFELLEVEG